MTVLQIFHDVRFAYAGDPKAVISLFVAIIAFIASGFLYYDLFVAKRIKGCWRLPLLIIAFTKTSIGVFALVRFFDALYDIAYLMENPSVVTTASQNLMILEIPFLGVGLNMLAFVLIYGRNLYRLGGQD